MRRWSWVLASCGSGDYLKKLIVNDIERYQLIVNDVLVYAKGLLKFDANPIKNGNNQFISYRGGYQLQEREWYEQGYVYLSTVDDDNGKNFYSAKGKGHMNFINPTNYKEGHYWVSAVSEASLDSINVLYSPEAEFEGWYTHPINGTKIEYLSDLLSYTDIFKPHDKVGIPTITLYAHWTIKTFTLTVENMEGSIYPWDVYPSSKSKFYYNGYWVEEGSVTLYDIPYNTEIISYLKDKILKPTFISGVRDVYHFQTPTDGVYIPNTVPLEKSSRKFTGWYTKNDGKGKILDKYFITEDITLYPQFEAAIILSPLIWEDKNGRIHTKDGYIFKKENLKWTDLPKKKRNKKKYGHWNSDDYGISLGDNWTPFPLRSGQTFIPYFSFTPNTTFTPDRN